VRFPYFCTIASISSSLPSSSSISSSLPSSSFQHFIKITSIVHFARTSLSLRFLFVVHSSPIRFGMYILSNIRHRYGRPDDRRRLGTAESQRSATALDRGASGNHAHAVLLSTAVDTRPTSWYSAGTGILSLSVRNSTSGLDSIGCRPRRSGKATSRWDRRFRGRERCCS